MFSLQLTWSKQSTWINMIERRTEWNNSATLSGQPIANGSWGCRSRVCTPSIHNQANAQTQWGTAAIWRPSRTRHTPDGLRILPLLLSRPQPSGCLLVACACLGTCAPGNAGCQARPWPREHIDANQSEMRFWNHHPQHSESTLMHCVQSSYLDQT